MLIILKYKTNMLKLKYLIRIHVKLLRLLCFQPKNNWQTNCQRQVNLTVGAPTCCCLCPHSCYVGRDGWPVIPGFCERNCPLFSTRSTLTSPILNLSVIIGCSPMPSSVSFPIPSSIHENWSPTSIVVIKTPALWPLVLSWFRGNGVVGRLHLSDGRADPFNAFLGMRQKMRHLDR